MMKKYNIKILKHIHTHARKHTRALKVKKCLTETGTCIDFFHLIKQKLMQCCLPTEQQRTLTKKLKVTYIMYNILCKHL